MSTLTITTTDEQEAALEWLAPGGGQQYLQTRIAEVLANYVDQYRVASAPMTVDQGVQAFLSASPEIQQQIMALLGLNRG